MKVFFWNTGAFQGYVGGTKGVQYRGPLQYEFMDKFVQNLLKPIKRIETVADLYKLMTQATVSIIKS